MLKGMPTILTVDKDVNFSQQHTLEVYSPHLKFEVQFLFSVSISNRPRTSRFGWGRSHQIFVRIFLYFPSRLSGQDCPPRSEDPLSNSSSQYCKPINSMDFSRKEKDTPSSSLLTSYRNQNTPDTSLRKHAATSTPPNTVLRGILSKKGRNKLYQPWAIRTVILDDESTLRYFDGQSLRGEVDVVGCFLRTLTPDQADGRSHAFEIANISEKGALKSSSLILAASSALEAQAWMDALITASHQTKKKIEPTARSNYSYESLDVSFCPFLFNILASIIFSCYDFIGFFFVLAIG